MTIVIEINGLKPDYEIESKKAYAWFLQEQNVHVPAKQNQPDENHMH